MEPESISALPDAELERLAAEGDAAAFGDLYERHSARLYDYLLRVLRDPDDAADVMQDTFVRALGALRAERAGTAKFTTWLYKIAHNLAVSRIERRARVIPLAPLDTGESEEHAPSAVSAAVTPEAAAEARELSELVWEAAQGLDPRQYSLLDLHVRQGLDSGEIADVLGVSKGNAYTMLSRLRDSFESAVAGLVMSRRARGTCSQLDAILDAHGAAPINVTLRKDIERHTAACQTCSAHRRRLVSATTLLRAMPLLPLPLLVKQRVGEAAAEEISANAAIMLSGSSGSQGGAGSAASNGSSWSSRFGAQASGVKGAAVAGIAIVAAVILPVPASPETPLAQPEVRVAAAAEIAPSTPPAPPPTVEPAPAPAAPVRAAARPDPPPPAAEPPAPEPTQAPVFEPTPPPTPPAPPPRARSDESDDPAPPAATPTPEPTATFKHCTHRHLGEGHDECETNDGDDGASGDHRKPHDDKDHPGKGSGHLR